MKRFSYQEKRNEPKSGRLFLCSNRQSTSATKSNCSKIREKIVSGSQESEKQKKVQNTQN